MIQTLELKSQDNEMDVQYDSVAISAGHFFIANDSSIYCSQDTVFYLADTIDYYQTRKHTPEKTDNFFENMGENMDKHKFTRSIHKLLFSVRHDKKEPKSKLQKSENSYLQYEGKMIEKIIVKDLEVFGTDIEDTTKHSTKSVVTFMNKLHISTKHRVIKHNLLFNEGAILHPTEMADNERVLRSLPYVQDARIYVKEPDDGDYKADLVVVTKDVFPLKFDISPGDLSESRFGFSNINLFGTGHELESDFVINDSQDGSFGYDLYYRVPNIKGYFVTGELNYANSFNKEGIGIRAFRDFITPEIKYAGGAEINLFRRREIRLDNGQIVRSPSQMERDLGTIFNFKEFEQDFWIGRSYRSFYNPPQERIKERLRFLVAARINNVRFVDRPDVDINTNQLFHHRTRFLGSIGFSSRRYYKDQLVKAFGRTEDIPAGNLIQFTGGYEIAEFGNRVYAGTKATKGGFFSHFGYVRGELQLGGFFRNGRFGQGVIETKVNYFTHLFTLHFFKIRQFIDLDYTLGVRRFDLEVLDINNENGLRGFGSNFLAGTQRLSLKAETVVFTPLYLASFRVALFGFTDMGFLSSNQGSPFSGPLYSSLGLGVRLRNDNLAFSAIQLRLAFFINPPIDEGIREFSFATKSILALDDFDLRDPQVLEFR